MALTGKTIGQLTYLSGITTDTLFPVELSGNTYHVSYSAFTSGNYTSVTYDELYSLYTGLSLIPGVFYLINDFQTCYDQPNYDNNGTPITTGNFKSGNTEQIVVLATSNTSLSPQAYSLQYPNDLLKYDITFNFTEVTNTPAKGRITERIDENNNRADYDFRSVQFIRYIGYFSENFLEGKVTIDGSGVVTGVNTFFTNYSPGQIIGIYNPYINMSCFNYYEITQITSNTEMVVSGKTIYSVSNTYYSEGTQLANYMSPFQCNISGGVNDEFAEYYTFNNNESYNTYLGDNVNYNTFILSNNVFLSGSYNNNTFGGDVMGNTFNDDMDSNTAGPYFQYNIITNDFDRNTIGSYFQRNIIDCDIRSNQIGDNFGNNMLGDSDGNDFDNNKIGSNFRNNFITFSYGDFQNNDIRNNFNENIIDGEFRDNVIISDFNLNVIHDVNFNSNQIGRYFYNNIITSDFSFNTISGNFYNNLIYSQFNKNTFGENVNTNTFGDPNSFGAYLFSNNNIGGEFNNNTFLGYTQFNTIGWDCGYNNIGSNFSYNQIGTNFSYNTIANDFGFGGGINRGNIVGNGFTSNIIGEYCYDNTFGDGCYQNNISDYFTNNKISYGMNSTTILDEDAGNAFQNNTISYGYFSQTLTLTGGFGGNPVLYSSIPTNVTLDYVDASGYVTFLSGGTIITQNIIITPQPTPTPTPTPTETQPEVTPTPTPTETQPEVTPTPTPTSTPTLSDFIVTVSQVGPDVLWSGSGSFNLTDLTFTGGQTISAGFATNQAIWATGPDADIDQYGGPSLTFPSSFGSTGGSGVPVSTGSTFGILPGGTSGRVLIVPTGYVSNTPIDGSTTYSNITISGMGLVSGTYVWSWGSGGNESTLTMIIE